MDKLTWSNLSKFKAANRTPVYPLTDPTRTNTGAFYQAYQNLAFYWILKAGHLVSMCSCMVEQTRASLIIEMIDWCVLVSDLQCMNIIIGKLCYTCNDDC